MNRTLIIDGVDAATFAKLEAQARDRGVELTAFARDLLEQSVGALGPVAHDLDSLAGTWSEADADEFDAAASRMRSIDPETWR